MTRRAWKLVATALLLAAEVGHSAQKRREISEREAHRLLTKYLKLRDRAVYRLGSDFGYKGFHFFQAEEGVASANLEDPTLGVLQVGYYAVDRNTADIWDAGFCREVSSPSFGAVSSGHPQTHWPYGYGVSKAEKTGAVLRTRLSTASGEAVAFFSLAASDYFPATSR
jgi:hypothetical protein